MNSEAARGLQVNYWASRATEEIETMKIEGISFAENEVRERVGERYIW